MNPLDPKAGGWLSFGSVNPDLRAKSLSPHCVEEKPRLRGRLATPGQSEARTQSSVPGLQAFARQTSGEHRADSKEETGERFKLPGVHYVIKSDPSGQGQR